MTEPLPLPGVIASTPPSPDWQGVALTDDRGGLMDERTQPWPPGTPNWVSLAADDPGAAVDFYADLFGWDCEHQKVRNYWLCKLDGTDVGGIGPKRPGTENLPDQWTTYLTTNHLEHTVATVTGHQGRLLSGPEPVGSYGRMAIVTDPAGAVFGLWQATDHLGAALATTPGSFVWSEALSSSYEQAELFYREVFGYRAESIGENGYRYAALYLGDRPVAGVGDLHADMPAGTAPHWLPYFAVAGADDTIERTRSAGGDLTGGPYDTDFGRCATLADPRGARFAVIQLADADSAAS